MNGRTPAQLSVPQLKRWLACRGAAVGGRKAELVLALGLGKDIIVLSGDGENTCSVGKSGSSPAATSFASDERRYFSFIGH